MAQTFTGLSSTNTTSRLQSIYENAVVTSEGALVFVEFDPVNSVYNLICSQDRLTYFTIATASSTFSGSNFQFKPLTIDSADNLYFLGVTAGSPNIWQTQKFTKNVGNSWTTQPVVVFTSFGFGSSINALSAVWCPGSGSTNNAGWIIVLSLLSGNTTFWLTPMDAGNLAISANNTSGLGQTLGTGYTDASAYYADMTTNGLGSQAGIFTIPLTNNNNCVPVTFTVNDAGTLSWNVNLTSFVIANTVSKVKNFSYAPNYYAITYPTASGNYGLALYLNGTQQYISDMGAKTNMPANSGGLGWDAYLDPTTTNPKIWIMAPESTIYNSTQQRIFKFGVSFDTTSNPIVTQDSSAVLVDTLTNITAIPSALNIRAVRYPKYFADYQLDAVVSSNNVILGDQVYLSPVKTVPSFVSVAATSWTTSGTAGVTATVTRPSTYLLGDLFVAIVCCDEATPTAPAGWTQYGDSTGYGTSFGELTVFTHEAGVSEPANYAFTSSSRYMICASIAQFRHATPTNIQEASIASARDLSLPSVTAKADEIILLSSAPFYNSTTQATTTAMSFYPPAGVNKKFENTGYFSANYYNLGFDLYSKVSAGGTEGPYTIGALASGSYTPNNTSGFIIVLSVPSAAGLFQGQRGFSEPLHGHRGRGIFTSF